jgi:hypothetical protein
VRYLTLVRLFFLLSHITYLLDDLLVSGLHCSDPTLPVRLLTRVYMVYEHLRKSVHPRCYTAILFHAPKNGRKNSTIIERICSCLKAYREIGYSTCAGLFFEVAAPLASVPRVDWSRFATTAVQPV